MKSRRDSLTFILLCLLMQSSLHGYELRKRISTIYGPFRALSFGVLYPQLKRMLVEGLIKEKIIKKSQRSRIEYAITPKGERVFGELNGATSGESWDDEGFEIRFAFFSKTSKRNRLRILEGRLQRMQEKAKLLSAELNGTKASIDTYLGEWRRHSLESIEREIIWLEKLIKSERKK